MFLPQEVIRHKRDGLQLAATEIAEFIRGVDNGTVGEGQIAAFAMAVYFSGMSRAEQVALTLAQRDSGQVIDWSGTVLHGPLLDKHSTGGVGDLVSLPLAAMLAACGAHVPMIAGRGLGHTGGTLDKLGAIPGYDLRPSVEQLRRVVAEVGCAIIGQTLELAPVDRRIYAVRDVTATVESIPLITASILSKKLASGAGALVMDVKVGPGALMPDLERARELAANIVDIGTGAGLRTAALLTDMHQPLAPCAGNAIELGCAIDYLLGRQRPPRLHQVTLALGQAMLRLGGLAADAESARARLEQVLASGAAAERFAAMVTALGGPADLLQAPQVHLASAPELLPVPAPRDGLVATIDCRALGLVVVELGGGRRRAEDAIDPAVGLSQLVELGQPVRAGQTLALVHARDPATAAAAAAAVSASIRIDDHAPTPPPAVIAAIEAV